MKTVYEGAQMKGRLKHLVACEKPKAKNEIKTTKLITSIQSHTRKAEVSENMGGDEQRFQG